MSYIVPNSNKPIRCNRCPFIDADSLNCTLMEDSYKYIELAYQHIHCPLIELPPHGRLIDADKLKSRLVLDEDASELKKIRADILKWIDIQETVIKAEGSETDA